LFPYQLALPIVTSASQQEHFHQGILLAIVGDSEAAIDYQTGYATGVAFRVTARFLRVESELVYRGASPDAWALGWLFNLWVEGRNSTRFTPYAGGGIGPGRGHAASPGIIENDIRGIAYQSGGGVEWAVSPDTSLDFGYRYFGISGTYEGAPGSKVLAGSSFLVGGMFKY